MKRKCRDGTRRWDSFADDTIDATELQCIYETDELG